MTLAARHRPHTLAAFLALSQFVAVSQAAVPNPAPQRVQHAVLHGADGDYDLDDGREMKLRVRGDGMVVSIGNQRGDVWRPAGDGALVSPDGKQRLRLYRDGAGTVNRLDLETRVAR